MKINSYRFLFRLVSYLADKTNGASIIVKYKLLLGTLIIGLTSASCGRQNPQQPTYNEPVSPEPDITQLTCYDTIIPPVQAGEDSIKIIPPKVEQYEVPTITCYDVSIKPTPEDSIIVYVSCYIQVPETPEEIPVPETIMAYGLVEEPPVSPVGNLEEFLSWVHQNIEYPQQVYESCIQGRTIVSFVVDTDGNIIEQKVVQSIIPEIDAAVLKAIASSGKWTPGRHKGQTVKTLILLPVKFSYTEE